MGQHFSDDFPDRNSHMSERMPSFVIRNLGMNGNVKCFGKFDTCLAIFDARSSTCTV